MSQIPANFNIQSPAPTQISRLSSDKRSSHQESNLANNSSLHQRMTEKFNKFIIEHVYKQEDLIFKVLYDKKNRPELYSKVMQAAYQRPTLVNKSENQNENNLKYILSKEELLTLNKQSSQKIQGQESNTTTSNIFSSNYLKNERQKQTSNRMGFEELQFLEEQTFSKIQTLYKYPLIVMLSGAVIFKNRFFDLMQNLYSKHMFAKIDIPKKRLHNALIIGLLFFEFINLTSFCTGTLFFGSQYAFALKKRYFTINKYEEDLIKNYKRQIQVYHRVLTENQIEL
eukprot:403368543